MANASTREQGRPRPFDLAGWRVRPQLNRISRGGTTRQVEPRIMQVLVILAARAGEIVTRDELLDTVWGETIVCEDALTRAVSDLRGLLGDDPRSPQVIETIRKSGYRLIAPVVYVEEERGAASRPAAPGRRSWRLLLAAATVAAAIAAALLVTRFRSGEEPATAATLAGTPFTSFRGDEIHPALSPDGNRVAFSWRGNEEGSLDIYVKQANTETPLRLTDHTDHETHPVWSPDGSAIAFYRAGEKGGIYTVPAIGGPARRVANFRGVRGFDRSPDGETFALAVPDSAANVHRIRLYSTVSGGERWLTDPPAGSGGDRDPRFSPDGRSLSFIRADAALGDDIWLIPPDGEGGERAITRGQHEIAGQDWRAGGRRIVFSAAPATEFGLWSLDVSGGDLTRLPTRGAAPLRPSAASRGRGLVYEGHTTNVNVWRLDLRGGGREEAPFIASAWEDCSARYSPDGERLLFLSARSGDREIWICRRDGTDPRRITSFEGTWISGAEWSPDGERIGFTAFPEGYSAVHMIDPEGGEPRRLTEGRRHGEFCGWSSDGEWLYFTTHREESRELRKVRAADGRIETVLSPVRRLFHASIDGRFLYYDRPSQNGIWRHSLAGDRPDVLVAPPGAAAGRRGERVTDRGVYAALAEGEGSTLLAFLDFETGKRDTLARLDGVSGTGLDVSPDGGEALIERVESSARDLVLVPDFF